MSDMSVAFIMGILSGIIVGVFLVYLFVQIKRGE
jgi:hypothetical protein